MRYYIKWTEHEIEGLGNSSSLSLLITEVDGEGRVLREIGLNNAGQVVHKAPSNNDRYGMFDNQIIAPSSLESNFDEEVFEELWQQET